MKRILTATLMTLTFTMMLAAQRGGPPNGGSANRGSGTPGMQRHDPSAGLKAALDLTDAQVTAIKALQQSQQDRAKVIRDEADSKRKELDTLLSATAPNATAVGNAAIALRATEKKMEGERVWFIAELKKLLTGTQQSTLDALIAAGTPIPGLGGGPRGGGPEGPRGGMRGPRPGGGL